MSPAFILSVNAGLLSVKLSLYSVNCRDHSPIPNLILESSVSRLTSPPLVFSYVHHPRSSGDVNKEDIEELPTHNEAFKYFLRKLTKDSPISRVSSGDNIKFACHRIVHGGDFGQPVIINSSILDYLNQLTDLALLHNAPALRIVKSCLKQLSGTTNIAYFDTSFRFTMPIYIKTYPLKYEEARQKKLRKYGFHEISYGFIVWNNIAEFLGKKVEETNIIALHLGSRASACAIKNGKSLDTSMGLTPFEGLPGASRSGSIDPSLVFHYTSEASHLSQANTAEMHISKVGFVGSYFVKLDGKVDVLVFAGGIGENGLNLRRSVVQGVQCLGFHVQEDGGEKEVKAQKGQVAKDITGRSRGYGGKKVLLVPNAQIVTII